MTNIEKDWEYRGHMCVMKRIFDNNEGDEEGVLHGYIRMHPNEKLIDKDMGALCSISTRCVKDHDNGCIWLGFCYADHGCSWWTLEEAIQEAQRMVDEIMQENHSLECIRFI